MPIIFLHSTFLKSFLFVLAFNKATYIHIYTLKCNHHTLHKSHQYNFKDCYQILSLFSRTYSIRDLHDVTSHSVVFAQFLFQYSLLENKSFISVWHTYTYGIGSKIQTKIVHKQWIHIWPVKWAQTKCRPQNIPMAKPPTNHYRTSVFPYS